MGELYRSDGLITSLAKDMFLKEMKVGFLEMSMLSDDPAKWSNNRDRYFAFLKAIKSIE